MLNRQQEEELKKLNLLENSFSIISKEQVELLENEKLNLVAEEEKVYSNNNENKVMNERKGLGFRIDSLINLELEKERNELKRRELQLLKRFSNDHQDNSSIPSQEPSKMVKEIFETCNGNNQIIKIMIRGKLFITTLSTIKKRDNMLQIMLSSGIGIDRETCHDAILLDELNPDYFPILLEHLRTGSTSYIGLWEEPSENAVFHLRELLRDSDFFGTKRLSSRIAVLIDEYQQELLKEPKQTKEEENNEESTESKEETQLLVNFANLTLKELKIMEDYVQEKREELKRENQILSQEESQMQSSLITFNVRGSKFSIPMSKLLIHKESEFPIILSGLQQRDEIFLDRDCEIFSYIFEFLESGKTDNIPKDVAKRKLIYKEAKAFKIYSLMDFVDPLRFPVEEIGPLNLKIKREEDFLRRIFVSDRNNLILNDPYLHLINIFENTDMFQASEPTIPLLFDFENSVEASELVNEYSELQIPLKPKICTSKQVFFSQFNEFSGGLFKDMDWSNVCCAGGSVLACLMDIPICEKESQPRERTYWDLDDGSDGSDYNEEETNEEDLGYFTGSSDEECFFKKPKRTPYFGRNNPPSKKSYPTVQSYLRTSPQWKNTDIDLFLYDIDEKMAEEKIHYLYNLFKKNTNDADIVMTRTQHAVTFKVDSLPPVQLILRLYKSPAEVLMGFDIPCCCVVIVDREVYCLPRAVVAISTRCNLVDVDRQSTTYELRLVKYALRGYRIGVPGFSQKKVANSDLYERQSLYFPGKWENMKRLADIKQVTGLARILLTLHAYKNNRRRKAVFKSIGGCNNLDRTTTMIDPSQDHDYRQIPVQDNSAMNYYLKLQTICEFTKSANKKTYFEFSLNDIEHILHTTTNPISDLPPRVKWITIDPTTQSIGSFHPHTRNFFKDAFTNPKHLNKQLCTYQWYYSKGYFSDRYYRTSFDDETCMMLEKNYRKFKRDESNNEFEPKPGLILDFSTFSMRKEDPPSIFLNMKTKTEVFCVTRARKEVKFIKRKKKLDEDYVLE